MLPGLITRHIGKLMVAILALQVFLLTALLTNIHRESRESAVAAAVRNATAMIQQYKVLRGYYAEHVVDKVKGKAGLRVSWDHEGRDDTIPLPATMIQDLSEILHASQNGTMLKLYSKYPFPNRRANESPGAERHDRSTRAGDAGRGFGVVANEVKELARQTRQATEDIIARIALIQDDTKQAENAIAGVSRIVDRIHDSQNAIASSVDEQTAMTSRISDNISEVAVGNGEISRNIALVASAAELTICRTNEAIRASANIEATARELMRLVDDGHRRIDPNLSLNSKDADEEIGRSKSILYNFNGIHFLNRHLVGPLESGKRSQS